MGLGPASRWEVRDRLRRSGVSGDRRDRPGLCRPDLRSEADADRRRAGDGAPDRLHAAACGRDRRNAAGAGPDRVEAAEASGPVLREAFRPQSAGAAEAEADDRPVRRSAAEAEACDPAADGAQAEAADSACSSRRSRSGGRWRACSGCLCTTSTCRPSGRTRSCGRCSRGSARRRRRREVGEERIRRGKRRRSRHEDRKRGAQHKLSSCQHGVSLTKTESLLEPDDLILLNARSGFHVSYIS